MTLIDQSASGDGIAIIGMAGRFPGAKDIDAYWRNLVAGVESITHFDKRDLETSILHDPAMHGDPRYVPARGVLEGVDLFDAEFFGISPAEARILDPQQRVFLEGAWEALERAGYDPGAFRGSIGVFAGMSNNTYAAANLQATRDWADLVGALQTMMGNEKDYLATRVSYKLDLKGPSINVQTACSTSLVAVCQAVQSLLAYQCDMALAGGVSIMLPQRRGYVCYDGSITSPDGHCRAFDARAEGTVFSNGMGIVVLKRLADALADRDPICAVIKGTALNNDGSGKVSFLAPSVNGHAEAVAMAQAFAGIEPRSVSYIEAHGTGTGLGDVVEVAALTQAFRAQTADTGFCALGSVKTNIGHLDAAAGAAGLIKAVLALQHRLIPPTLHFTTPNPKLSLETTPFFVNTTPLPWGEGATRRRAGVSSLGVGGTNAHVVVEEAPPVEASSAGKGTELLVISARTATALDRATANVRDFLDAHPAAPFADIAYTLQVGRRRFAHRRAIVCRDREDGVRALSGLRPGRLITGDLATSDAAVGFVLNDESGSIAGRGRDLHDREAAFRDAFDECAAIVRRCLDVDVRELLYPAGQGEFALEPGTPASHAALFTIEYATARLWMRWGVKPRLIVSGGVGEFVAAALAGVFSLPDALTLVIRRAEMLANGDADLDAFASLVDRIRRKAPNVELSSFGAAEWLSAAQAVDPRYWASTLRAPASHVEFARLPIPTPLALITIGSGAQDEALRLDAQLRPLVSVIPTLRPGRSDVDSMLESLAHLWLQGVDVDWVAVHEGESRARLPLPTYPFERERHWIDPVVRVAGDSALPVEADVARRDAGLRAALPPGDWVSRLVSLFSELSGLAESELHPASNFFELGLDSLFLTQAAGALQKSYGVRVTFRELLEELNTITLLAAHLDTQLPTPAAARPAAAVQARLRSDGAAAGRDAEAAASPLPSRGFGPFRPLDRGSPAGLTQEQSRALDDFVARYTAATAESKRLTARHRRHLADPRTVAGFRPLWKEMVYPIVVDRALGSRLWDVDGNEYVDLVNGFGTTLFGHSPSFVTAAVEAQLKRGIPIGPQSPLAGEVAAMVCGMTGHERAAFCNTGSEAVTAAIRSARTVTGRETIAMFEGAYHGTFDEVLARGATVRGERRAVPIAPGIPDSAYEHIVVLEYGSASALEVLRSRGHEFAAVLVEPVQSRRPELRPVPFLRDLRAITAASGTALVFDEVVTGFRVHQGGAQALFGIHPDLATYGKVVGGGLPIGVVAGKAAYLDALDGGHWDYDDQSFPSVGMTFFAGTFMRHPLALAAAAAVLTHLADEGPELQRGLNLRTTELVETLKRGAVELDAPVTISHFSSWFCVNFAPDVTYAPLFYAFMRNKGIHTWEGRACFITTAHTADDLSRIVSAFTESLIDMRRGGFLPAAHAEDTPPVPGARRGKRPDGRDAWFLPDPDRPGRYLEVTVA